MIKQETISKETLQVVFQKTANCRFVEKDGHIFLVKEQNAWIQKIARRLGVKIPERTTLELDDYGSFIFRKIDGKMTVEEIGIRLAKRYPETHEQLYERLVMYLSHLKNTRKVIE